MRGHNPHLAAAGALQIAFHLKLGGRQPMQKPLQRGDMGLLIGQRLRQKLVKGVDGVRSQTADNGVPPPLGQYPGEQFMGRCAVGAVQPGQQLRVGSHPAGALMGAAAQRAPQTGAAPIMGQFKKIRLIQANQRAFQNRRQGQIILGQKQKLTQLDQIHDRQLIGQNHPIDAGDGDALAFESARQGLHQGVAAADQHHHIAGFDGPFTAGQGGAVVEPLADLAGDPFGQDVARVILRDLAVRRRPNGRRILVADSHRRP